VASNPPFWLLCQTILPGGARLCKNRPRWTPPVVVHPSRKKQQDEFKWQHDGQWYANRNGKVVKIPTPAGEFISLQVEAGNLEKSDYFQWVGSRYSEKGHGWAMCRACGTIRYNETDRKAHRGDGCGKLLQKAYRLLEKDGKCVICNEITSRRLYGLPICFSVQCETKWKFGFVNIGLHVGRDVPLCVVEAIRLTKQNNSYL